MREAYSDQGFSFQPAIKYMGAWNRRSRSFSNVVSRLYDPSAMIVLKREKEEKHIEYELRSFTGIPKIKVRYRKCGAM